VAPRTADPAAIVKGALAIARAMGYGHWVLESYEPEKSLVLRSPSTYESAYRKLAYPADERGSCFVFQGAALATMQLAHGVPWAENPALTGSLYRTLAKTSRWQVDETHCVAAGNSVCRVVVK